MWEEVREEVREEVVERSIAARQQPARPRRVMASLPAKQSWEQQQKEHEDKTNERERRHLRQ